MSIFTYANPQRFLRFVHYVFLPVLLIGAALSAIGLYTAFALAPADYQQGETVRIMYIHVPAAWLSMVSSLETPDPDTLVMTWNQVYFLANRVLPREVPAVASHIAGPLYDQAIQSGDKQSFLASPYWSDSWVGLGPYRLVNRVVGID